MISLSHWGMYPKPQKPYTKAWYNEQRDSVNYYDAEYIHGVFQKLQFGPDLP
jgi:hypothetical protein